MNKNTGYIKLSNIRKTYNNEVALDVKDLTIHFGNVIAVMGYSGSGKSTLVSILGLIDTPDMIYGDNQKPSIFFSLDPEHVYNITYGNDRIIAVDNNGNTLDEVSVRAKIFGYIFQKHYLHGNFSIEQNIQIPLIIENFQLSNENIESSLDLVNLDLSTKEKYPDHLSGGQAQRASILRGIIKQNKILIADEPTSSLDVFNAKNVLLSIKQQILSDGFSELLLWVTHDVHLIAQYADNIIVLSDGKVVSNGVIKNPGVGKENEISSFLNTDSVEVQKKDIFSFKKKHLNFLDKVKYVYNYAYKELFKSPLRPTFDFKIGASSIIITLFFLLFIAKINHSMNSLLTFKLNNPSVNNFSVIARGGASELSKEDVSYINKTFGKDIKSASPVYLAPIDIKDNKSQDDLMDITDSEYVAGFRFVTFEKDDPVLESIIQKDNFLLDKTDALRSIKGDNIDSLIVQNKVLQELGYEPNQGELSIRLDTFIKSVSISVIDSVLPNNVDGILRSELYLKAYFGEHVTQKPSMSHIVVYPKDIQDSIRLSNEITKSGKYSISNFYELKTKIETILDISKIISAFSKTLSIALILLSVSFVYLSLYRGIEKKRREIGVFLANGISRKYFYLFYSMQALLYFLITTLISILIYYFIIEHSINSFLVNSSYLQSNYGDLSGIIEYLSLPFGIVFFIYAIYFIFIQSLFLFMINKFVSKKPIELMRE